MASDPPPALSHETRNAGKQHIAQPTDTVERATNDKRHRTAPHDDTADPPRPTPRQATSKTGRERHDARGTERADEEQAAGKGNAKPEDIRSKKKTGRGLSPHPRLPSLLDGERL